MIRGIAADASIHESRPGTATIAAEGDERIMNGLTNDMTRLAGEIRAAHNDRERFMGDLRRGLREFRLESAHNRAARHDEHFGMAKQLRLELGGFRSDLGSTVANLRKGFADDIAGCRAAWRNATTTVKKPRRGMTSGSGSGDGNSP